MPGRCEMRHDQNDPSCFCKTCLAVCNSLQNFLQVGDLVAADNVAFARLVLKHLPEKHAGFVARLQSQPEMQYRQNSGPLLFLGLLSVEFLR